MDLTQLANLGEFIGGVAVLVTLVYLAVQVKHTRKSMGFRARQASTDRLFQFTQLLLNDSDLEELYSTGLKSYRSLEGKDRRKFNLMASQTFLTLEDFYLEYPDELDSDHAAYMRQIFRWAATRQGFKEWLQDSGVNYSTAFLAELGSHAEKPANRLESVGH